MTWTKITTPDILASKERVLFKHGPKQIVMLRHGDKLVAFDNRCPHQGFPLSVGTMTPGEGCVLTCNWHNWKFDLDSGACLTGGDRLRTYPTREKDDALWADLSDPTPDQVREAVLADLRQAFDKRQYGRFGRELARLALQGLDPLDGLRRALVWYHDKLEFGMTHAVAAAADWLRLYDEHEGRLEDQLILLTEALDHLSDDALRHPVFAYSEDVQPWDTAAFLTAVENEDEPAALARIRGAVAAGQTVATLAPTLSTAALAHYNSFGHSIIYVEKVVELAARLGDEVGATLLLPLVRHLVGATREDLLPEFKAYAPARVAFPLVFGDEDGPLDPDKLRGSSVAKSLSWVSERAETSSPAALHRALLLAASDNLRDFDESYQLAFDRPTKDHVGWLDCTHALTMANAVRVACERSPELWPEGLLQLACFTGRNQRYLDPAQGNVGAADPAALDAALFDVVTDHGYGQPIYSAHLVKTWVAIREEGERLSRGDAARLYQGLKRLTGATLKQKHARRQAREALELVARDVAPAAGVSEAESLDV